MSTFTFTHPSEILNYSATNNSEGVHAVEGERKVVKNTSKYWKSLVFVLMWTRKVFEITFLFFRTGKWFSILFQNFTFILPIASM